MLAKELISDVVPPLKTSDTGQHALNLMDVFRISHLPIVNNAEFLGLISDKDIYNMNMAEEAIGAHKLSLFSPYVFEDQHIYEVIGITSRLKLSIIPVLDRSNKFLGIITLHDLVTHFAGLSALEHPGGILVLDMHEKDYSLTQIAQIVESNDAKILSLYISGDEESTKLSVTLKINRTDLSSVVQTFERYNYEIKASYMNEEDPDNFYQSRYDLFMRYLNI
jgi:acetoin utilization protein AcuB